MVRSLVLTEVAVKAVWVRTLSARLVVALTVAARVTMDVLGGWWVCGLGGWNGLVSGWLAGGWCLVAVWLVAG